VLCAAPRVIGEDCRGTEWRSKFARAIGASRAATPRESSASARNAQFKRACARRGARARAVARERAWARLLWSVLK